MPMEIAMIAVAGVGIGEVLIPGGTLAGLVVVVRWFMARQELNDKAWAARQDQHDRAMDQRNAVIEKIVDRILSIVENNTRVVQEFADQQRSFGEQQWELADAIRRAPCGELLRKLEEHQK